MNKKLLTILVGVGILGALMIFSPFGPPTGANAVHADSVNQVNFLQDFYNKYFKPLGPQRNSSSTAESLFSIAEPKAPLAPALPYAPTIDYEQAVIKAVEEASPAVVSIIISKDLPVLEQCPYNPLADLPPEFQQLFGNDTQFYQPCEKGTKRQEVGGGSGFIISSDGLIVTNKHVAADEKASYTVLTNDGKKYDATVLARDPVRDLAIIKITANNLRILKLGDSNSIKLGQTAIAIGNALGEFRNTVSVGVISGLARTITASGGGMSERIQGVLQTDAAINQGNSGGPLLNLKGEVIGINVATVSGAQNIGFAIPINQVKRAIESVKKNGTISTPYLGTRYMVVTGELKEKEKLPVDYGVLLRESAAGPAVAVNSPAEKAGLKAQDIILEVNGEKVTVLNSLGDLINKYNVGDVITLTILRSGREVTLKARLEERPKNL